MFIKYILDDESGQSIVEYGLILFFIALVVIIAARVLGVTVRDFFYSVEANWPS